MSEEIIVTATPTPNVVAQDLIVSKIVDSRTHVLAGIDLETEGGKALATMYDRGASDALLAVTGAGTLTAEEDGKPVVHEVVGSELLDLFWKKVNS